MTAEIDSGVRPVARRTPLPTPLLPPIVQMLLWMYAPCEFLQACARRYGDTYTLRFPGREAFVFSSDPQVIRRAFTATPDEYEVREANKILRPLLGDHSLLLIDGDHHLRERRLLMPPFHGERLQVYASIITEATEAVIDRWPHSQPFSLHASMQAITLEVILRAVFGIQSDADLAHLRRILPRLLATVEHPISLLLARSGTVTVPWYLRPFERWLPTREFEAQIAEVDEVLHAEIRRRRTDQGRGEDVLSMLVAARDEAGEGLSDAALRDEMMTLLVAGHETSATTLSWAFSHVFGHPAVEQLLRDEIDAVVGDGPITAAHLSEMPYLEATLKETLRLTPILPNVGRRIREDWEVGDVVVPAGSTLCPCIYLAHRRPDFWPRPEMFDPARFIDTRISPQAWFPFGGGARRCIGVAFAMFEMRLILATVLRRARLRLAPGYRPRVVRRSITLAPSQGVPVISV